METVDTKRRLKGRGITNCLGSFFFARFPFFFLFRLSFVWKSLQVYSAKKVSIPSFPEILTLVDVCGLFTTGVYSLPAFVHYQRLFTTCTYSLPAFIFYRTLFIPAAAEHDGLDFF